MIQRWKQRKKLGEIGQSTIEFALTMLLLMAFILFYLQLSMIFAFGNFAHYATFMAARAYLAAGHDEGDQQSRARTVIVRLLKRSEGQAGADKFPMIARGEGEGDVRGLQIRGEQFVAGDPSFSWMEGVRYTFRSKLFMLPLAGRSEGGSEINTLKLTSESWLGRDPSYMECQGEMSKLGEFFDNGC